MQRNQVLEHCKAAENDGISIWQYPPDRKRPQFLTSTLKTIPNLDSNSTYIIILQKSNCTILNDVPYNSYKVFFWVGSRSADYDKNFKESVVLLSELQEAIPGSKLRFYIEFQYSESFEFFSLFTRQDLSIERCISVSAIQYQDFLKTPSMKLLSFPKLLVFELLDNPSEYPHYYVRIYEKKHLDVKVQSKNVYFQIEGNYKNAKGEPINENQPIKGEVIEHVTGIQVLFGSRVNYVLSQFVKRFLENYRIKGVQITEEKQKGESLSSKLWQEIEDQAMYLNAEVDRQWPLESAEVNDDGTENYPYPYSIDTWEWKTKATKEIEETFDDQGNVKFTLQNEFNVAIKKQEIEFDPNKIHLFRVSLTENQQRIQQFQMQHRSKHDEMEFKDRYIVTFQQLVFAQTDSSMLSSSHSYLIYTPLTLFLWHGSFTDIYRKKGSLHLLKSFLNTQINEQINYQPSYLEQHQNIDNAKFRIELQYYESQRFRSLFSKAWNDDKLDYLMMGMLRNDQIENSSEDSDQEDTKDEEGDSVDMFDKLAGIHKKESGQRLQSEFSKGPVVCSRMDRGTERRDLPDIEKKRSSTLAEKQQNVVGRRNTNFIKKLQINKIEETKKDQEKFLGLVSGIFEPLSILSKVSQQKEFQFDSLTMYQIEGSKFVQILDLNEVGILDASKSYFVIFSKANTGLASSVYKQKHAIYLWRGSDQSSMTLAKAMNKFQETEFRFLKADPTSSNTIKRKTLNQSASDFALTSLSDLKSKGTEDLMSAAAHHSKPSQVLTPIISVKFAQEGKVDEVKVQNMKSIIEDSNSVVNLRSILSMDNEPLHFLEAFYGQLVIVTNDYMKTNQTDQNTGDGVVSLRMMFQLIGVPTLNQKAREVQPIYESLTSSGLYIILTQREVFYWIGHDYYQNYLDESNYKQQSRLISEPLYKKLAYVFSEDSEEDSQSSKKEINFMIEGDESKKFMRILKGKSAVDDELDQEQRDEDQDKPMIKFELNFIKKLSLPQEPRLFCLLYNGNTVEYDIETKDDQQQINAAEREAIVFREIHSFTQKSLDQRGVFLLDFGSESFIWVGKKVADKDRLYILQLAYQTIAVLHDQGKDQIEKMGISMIESGHEPEIFKLTFKDGWQNFEHTSVIEESESDDSEQEGTNTMKKSKKQGPELLPESLWIN